MKLTITEVLKNKDGVSLAITDTDEYLVGIGYRVGQTIDELRYTVDFARTKNLQIAETIFTQRVGA